MKHVILVLVLLVTTLVALAQEASPALQAQIDSLESFVTRNRHLTLLQPVDRRFPTRAEAIAEIKALYNKEIPPEEAARLDQFYVAFDFLPPGSDYVSLYLTALEAQVGGFYDPDTKEMNTLLLSGDALGDRLPLLEQIVYTHEFTHALQDQHFDLNALEDYAGDDRDRQQAIIALIEGDATLVMNLYVQQVSQANPLGTAMQLLAEGFSSDTLFLPPGLPDIIARELLSSYTDGAAFVGILNGQGGGWEAVDAAFAPDNLPQSTEQILHPDKYLAHEGPMAVTLTSPTLEPAWETAWDTTFGEFYLREYLRTQLPFQQAAQASAGWGGDHYQVYHNTGTDQLAWLMRIEWDAPRDASEFTGAFVSFLKARFEGVVAENSCWATATESLCFDDGESWQVIAYAPTLPMAQDLLSSQMAQ